jgi:hypothetical protein
MCTFGDDIRFHIINTHRMKQVHFTINVSESKYAQLVEYLTKNFGKVEVTEEEDFIVQDWQKEIVRERIKNAKPEDYIPWVEARKQLKFKSK